jgi:hypothetical protein
MGDMDRTRSLRVASAGLLVAAQSAGTGRAARAVETAGDVETDHVDPADDGGPRAWGLVLRPLGVEPGLVGLEVGVALESRAVLTVEGDWLLVAPTQAYGARVGVALYPTRFAFHGLYVHPRVEMWHAAGASGASDAVGAAAVVGYEWTARVGATLRLGGGLAYLASSGAGPALALPVPLSSFVPELDAAAGWVW